MKSLDDFFKQNNNVNSEIIISDLIKAEINPENCYIIGALPNPYRVFILENLEGMGYIFICLTIDDKDSSLKINKFSIIMVLQALTALAEVMEEKMGKNNENT